MADVMRVVIAVAFIAVCWIVYEQESEKCEQRGGTLVHMKCIDKDAVID
jgi:hypothetical protein